MKMLPRCSETVTGRGREEDCDPAGHLVGRERVLGHVRNEIAPSLLCFLFMVTVVEEGSSERAGHGQKN